MLKSTLLVLTLMSDGGVRVTLSEAADAAECETSRAAVVAILTEAGRAPLAALCGETGLEFTQFMHGVPEEEEIHRYRVELPAAGGFTVIPLAEGEACEPAEAEAGTVHCARSAQEVVGEGQG